LVLVSNATHPALALATLHVVDNLDHHGRRAALEMRDELRFRGFYAAASREITGGYVVRLTGYYGTAIHAAA
jgi:hypothetical protein